MTISSLEVGPSDQESVPTRRRGTKGIFSEKYAGRELATIGQRNVGELQNSKD
jgi:hypothetical protein